MNHSQFEEARNIVFGIPKKTYYIDYETFDIDHMKKINGCKNLNRYYKRH